MDPAARTVVDRLFERTDDLVSGMLEAMRGRPSYAHVPEDDVRAAVHQHVRMLTEHLRTAKRVLDPADAAFLRDMGEQRAQQGVSLEDLVHVWTVTFDLLRAHVLQAVDLLADHRDVLRLLLRTTDQLDRGLLSVVAGYQRAGAGLLRAERVRRGEVVRRLTTPGADPGSLRRTAEDAGLDAAAAFQPFRARPAHDGELVQLESLLAAAGQPGVVLHGLVDGDLCGVTTGPLAVETEQPIGSAAPVPLVELPEAFRLASRALTVATRLRRPGLCRFDDLGLVPAVHADNDVGDAMWRRYVAPWAAQGASGDAVLETVEAYLEHQAKLAPTARALHVHLNTVRYRIARFEETTGVSLRDTRELAEVWWALQRRRLLAD